MKGSLLGIPWMAGIPGTVGGWIKMNAGAFGHSISEVLKRVKVDGRWLDASECGFGYRRSSIDGEIQDFELVDDLPSGDAAEYLARRAKFPSGTKGSVFKNPPGDHAGRLLEAAGCKGMRVGGARVWENHANVIVCDSSATASDFLALVEIMKRRVRLRFGIALEPEVCGLP
jgi:UDP-N-acetylmuramate dehydrogenase